MTTYNRNPDLTLAEVLAIFPEYSDIVAGGNIDATDNPEWFIFYHLLDDGRIPVIDDDSDESGYPTGDIEQTWEEFDVWEVLANPPQLYKDIIKKSN